MDYQRLAVAYRRALRRADDARRLHALLQRSVCRSLVGLAAALETRDAFSTGHGERVAGVSARIARRRRLPPDDVAAVEQAALLHDIGAIAVPEVTLRAPRPLDPTEWEHVRRHPTVGAQIAAPFDFLVGVAPFIRHHHERWDGAGYPDGLAGAAIPLGARIIAAADLFDAVSTTRPYRCALGLEDALACVASEAGRALDPGLVDDVRWAVRGAP
jgi:HD-GYP domain-containing protein (c-di-GMP phosphodiesterase class II)